MNPRLKWLFVIMVIVFSVSNQGCGDVEDDEPSIDVSGDDSTDVGEVGGSDIEDDSTKQDVQDSQENSDILDAQNSEKDLAQNEDTEDDDTKDVHRQEDVTSSGSDGQVDISCPGLCLVTIKHLGSGEAAALSTDSITDQPVTGGKKFEVLVDDEIIIEVHGSALSGYIKVLDKDLNLYEKNIDPSPGENVFPAAGKEFPLWSGATFTFQIFDGQN